MSLNDWAAVVTLAATFVGGCRLLRAGDEQDRKLVLSVVVLIVAGIAIANAPKREAEAKPQTLPEFRAVLG
jgi:hypothetical protein